MDLNLLKHSSFSHSANLVTRALRPLSSYVIELTGNKNALTNLWFLRDVVAAINFSSDEPLMRISYNRKAIISLVSIRSSRSKS